jgi:hypothetical protein
MGFGCPELPPTAVRLVLVGDAGEADDDDPVLAAAGACARHLGATATVLLGDNVYGDHDPFTLRVLRGDLYGGLRRNDLLGRGQLDAQLHALGGPDHPPLLVVPGNHDWYAGPRGVVRQRDRVEAAGAEWFAPFDADDPCDVDVGVRRLGAVTVLGVDSMALFRCGPRARAVVADALRREARTDGWLVVAAHHPVATIGEHAGRNLLTGQDVDGARYRRAWTSVFVGLTEAQREHTVLVAGHDHLLALLPDREGFALQVVSGAGSRHHEPARRRAPWEPSSPGPGFVLLDLGEEGRATWVDASGTGWVVF